MYVAKLEYNNCDCINETTYQLISAESYVDAVRLISDYFEEDLISIKELTWIADAVLEINESIFESLINEGEAIV